MKINQVLQVPLDCSLPSQPGPEPWLPGASLNQELSPSFPPAIRTPHKVPTSGLACHQSPRKLYGHLSAPPLPPLPTLSPGTVPPPDTHRPPGTWSPPDTHPPGTRSPDTHPPSTRPPDTHPSLTKRRHSTDGNRTGRWRVAVGAEPCTPAREVTLPTHSHLPVQGHLRCHIRAEGLRTGQEPPGTSKSGSRASHCPSLCP